MSFVHVPVLVSEVVELLAPTAGNRIVDGTVGGGGHAAALLRAAPESELLGIDRDDEALAAARERLAEFGNRVHLVHGSYADMAQWVKSVGWEHVDRVLLDLGVSSPQIDTESRGFAHRLDGPLDMRMDRRMRLTAASLLNHMEEEELARIFREYGEEPQARRMARAVVARRDKLPWTRTTELTALIQSLYGHQPTRGLPVATRCFQALRIAVNDELGQLERGLVTALGLLRPGGRLAVIAFHSLEDRRVKNFFRHEASACICPPGIPECRCGKRVTLRILTRKPIHAREIELADNRRAAPAKLRVAERL